jgi:hypothetical protein
VRSNFKAGGDSRSRRWVPVLCTGEMVVMGGQRKLELTEANTYKVDTATTVTVQVLSDPSSVSLCQQGFGSNLQAAARKGSIGGGRGQGAAAGRPEHPDAHLTRGNHDACRRLQAAAAVVSPTFMQEDWHEQGKASTKSVQSSEDQSGLVEL